MRTDISYNLSSEKTPIILLHGWGMNKTIWSAVVKLLPEGIQSRIRCLDLPGYGDNKVELADYNLPALTHWLASEVTTPSIVIGWSLGGLLAQNLAFHSPEKVTKVGLIASSPKFMKSDTWAGIKPDVLTLFLNQLSKDHVKTVERFLANQAMGSESARKDITALKNVVLNMELPSQVALQEGLRILQGVDLRDQLSQLTCPVFALFGKLDSLVAIVVEQELKNLNANIQTSCFNKSSHAPFISDTAKFNTWLIKNIE
jgi:pimeloyl-[acyl-carrier protein] methyl ester esterase